MRSGMTLMSVMVAVALAGVVALAVARLLGNQTKTMATIRLREQREHLLKHYKNIVVSGWDASRKAGDCPVAICTRTKEPIIPGAYGNGSLLLADDLYDYNYDAVANGTAGRWWKVTAERVDTSSGDILQSDSYVQAEDMVAMQIKVDFVRKEHPLINLRLAPREEIVFLHHNTRSAFSGNITQCDKVGGIHRTQLDGTGGELYSGQGALIQYDFISNYSKCSQVPLIENNTTCPVGNKFEALLGFFRTQRTGSLRDQRVTGKGICSIRDKNDVLAEIRHGKDKRTVVSIDCRKQGYVERIKDDETPECVKAPDSGGRIYERVAAMSSANCPTYKTFRLEERTSPGGDGSTATYAEFDCVQQVYRKKGVNSYKGFGVEWSGELYKTVPFENTHGVPVGPVGPRGEKVDNGPPGAPGPPGPRGRSCRNPCPTPTPTP